MKTNAAGALLIRQFEGFRPNAYRDVAGVWTIGYGSTRIKDRGVHRGDKITQVEAIKQMEHDLDVFEATVEHAVTRPMTPNQNAAMVSLAYNIGGSAFAHSTLVRKFNAGDIAGAADEFLRWDKATIKGKLKTVRGLTRRREAERKLFLTETP